MEASSYKLPLRIKLTSPILGDICAQNGLMRLNIKSINGNLHWVLKSQQIRWALGEAFDAMGILGETSVDYIRLPALIQSPKIHNYKRRSSRSDRLQKCYECYQEGTAITIPLFVLGSLEQSNPFQTLESRPPTKEEVRQSFEIIGQNIGLSPWGSNFGYGRFILLPEKQDAGS